MYSILICIGIFLSSEICSCTDSILDKSELVLAFMTNRHGDRTPVPEEMYFAVDKARVLEKVRKYGYGQLTDRGKTHAYELGKFIRRRYNSLLCDQYRRSQIHIRSTDSTRAEMTVLVAMTAVYPPGKDNWSKIIKWNPVPYTTVRAKYDPLLAIGNCPVLAKAFKDIWNESIPSMSKYIPLMKELSKILQTDVSQMPIALFMINDMFNSQMSLGIPLTPTLYKLLPEIQEGAGQAADVLFGIEKYLPLQAGVLLKDFFDAVDNIISGKAVPSVYVYSGHDVNVFTFSAVSMVRPRIGVPKYGCMFILELRRLSDGRYIVVPVYLPQPGANEEYLQVDGCEGFCELDRFIELTSKYARNETEWRTECGFTEDFMVDTSDFY